MIPLTIPELADVVGGEPADASPPEGRISEVLIDSRACGPGALFVPLRGERADGHDYVAAALRAGAVAYLWEARRPDPPAPGAVVVDDPADALLGLGRWVRDTVDPLTVAVTGSNGKTTTKDLVAAAVGGSRRVIANVGSYNNELGVPLTCCRLVADTEVLVAEVGARGIGHIARLAPLLAPDIAVVTLVGASHLELLGSLDGVARAKGELVEALDADGVAVLNADDHRVAAMATRAAGRVVTYGHAPDAAWRPQAVTFDDLARPALRVRHPDGGPAVEVRLPLPGAHNVSNALAALAVADLCGVDLEAAAAGIAGATVSRWRMEVLRTREDVTILNDAYNANPSSTAAALRTLARMRASGRRWAVLGHMAEIGPTEAQEHRRIGELAATVGVDALVAVGERAAPLAEGACAAGLGDVRRVATPDEAARALREVLAPGDVVLLKASRSAGLEGIADALGEARA
jgi:UDP-N-acetylmuramoyl-tripeptide--D-alanyl-D-alanine ligase